MSNAEYRKLFLTRKIYKATTLPGKQEKVMVKLIKSMLGCYVKKRGIS